MSWYSVMIEARTDGTGEIDEDAVGRLSDLVHPHYGVAGGGGIPPRWDARISVHAADAVEAVSLAAGIVTPLGPEAGQPAGAGALTESTRGDVADGQPARPRCT